MWDAVAGVDDTYDPIVFEGEEPETAVVLNAGPGTIEVHSWDNRLNFTSPPTARMELRPGNQTSTSGMLIRLHKKSGTFAAAAWKLTRSSTGSP